MGSSAIWVRKEDWGAPSVGAAEELNRFRQELGVEVIDICLIHCTTDPQWPDTCKRVRDELSQLKQNGRDEENRRGGRHPGPDESGTEGLIGRN